jgi:hypothetical protein
MKHLKVSSDSNWLETTSRLASSPVPAKHASRYPRSMLLRAAFDVRQQRTFLKILATEECKSLVDLGCRVAFQLEEVSGENNALRYTVTTSTQKRRRESAAARAHKLGRKIQKQT